MFQKSFQRIVNSSFPLLILGGVSLFLYFFLGFLTRNLLGGEMDTLLSRFPESFFFITDFSYLLFLFYTLVLIWTVRQSKSVSIRPSYWVIAIVFFLLFCTILLTIPPLTSQDVFWNLFQGKIFTHYQQNPYLVTPQEFSEDSYLGLIRVWQDFPMTHGPIWTLLVSTVSILTSHNLSSSLFILRMILFIILGLVIGLTVLVVRRVNPRWSFLAFIALSWQPLLLIETINGAHNDILIGLTAILGLFLIFQGRYFQGFAVLWIGVLVKYVILLLIPLGIIFVIRRHSLKAMIKITAPIIGIIVLLTLIAYLPFGYNIFQFSGLSYQSRLFEYAVLPPVPFWLVTVGTTISGINIKEIIKNRQQIPLLLFKDRTALESLVFIVRILSIAIFLVFYSWLIFKPFQDERDLFKRGFWIFAVYLLIAPFWFMNWYLIWLMPLAVIGGWGLTLLVSGWSVIVFPYPFPMLQIVTPLVFAAAFLIMLIRRISARHKKSLLGI